MTTSSVCRTFKLLSDEVLVTKFTHLCGLPQIGFSRFTSLRSLKLYARSSIPENEELSLLTNLESLELRGRFHECLTGLTNLKHLFAASVAFPCNLPSGLTSLRVFSHTGKGDVFFQNLPFLKSLEISDFVVDSILHLTSLTSLSLVDNFYDIFRVNPKKLAQLPNLTNLHLMCHAMEANDHPPSLRGLYWSKMPGSPDDFPDLENLWIGEVPRFTYSNLTNLQWLRAAFPNEKRYERMNGER